MKVEAEVVADSISPDGVRIITIQGTLHRFVLGELAKHRALSMSAQSSRAVPVQKMIDIVKDHPAMPVFWGKNQPGMRADEQLEGEQLTEAIGEWHFAAINAVNSANYMNGCGAHKQIVNRVLEPYLWQRVLLTATEWDNLFKLRRHKDAQPELKSFVDEVFDAMQDSTPLPLRHSEWHVPFVGRDVQLGHSRYIITEDGETEEISLDHAKKYSAARCATTSYRTDKLSLERGLEIYKKLVESEPHHCYDDQTEVLTSDGFKLWSDVSEDDTLASVDDGGNFRGFKKPIQLIEQDYTGDILQWDTGMYSSAITPNHRVLYRYRKHRSVKSTLLTGTAESLEKAPHYIPLLPNKTFTNDESFSFTLGKLYGYALGDGFAHKDSPNVLKFRFVKTRKLDAVISLCHKLNIQVSEKQYGKVTNLSLVGRLPKQIATSMYDESRVKRMPEDYLVATVEFQSGLLAGLSESDGTNKRGKIKFSSTSKSLADGFYNLSLLLGASSSSMYVLKTEEHKDHFVVTNRLSDFALVNDPRKKESHCTRKKYSGKVYCATIEDGFLIVRRKGHAHISGNSVPLEHVCRPLYYPRSGTFGHDDLITHISKDGWCWSGNSKGWGQMRKEVTGTTLER